jgi:hypothetical protein
LCNGIDNAICFLGVTFTVRLFFVFFIVFVFLCTVLLIFFLFQVFFN